MDYFDLTPDPKVLIALTRTPMQPMDALCELIDNSIDSFQMAKLQGYQTEYPFISINIPKQSELKNADSAIRIVDNGPGLTWEMAEKALRAGYSGNNAYDSLGLFGLGFNISTGKLGRITKFFSARADDEDGLEVVVDLEQIRESKSYKVKPKSSEKPKGFQSGTIIEVSHWWPDGDPNGGFVRKLAQYGMPTVRAEIGRRYSTILREGKIKIKVNNEDCIPFEHCVWDDSRYVERKGHGQIPAVIRFNELIGTQKRCGLCTCLIEKGTTCPECGSEAIRTLEERIRGWVGIQRFDDATNYGVDLIRNGRSIRIAEKSAFFEYVDEFKRTIKDYPIDSQYGRIVGEIHLNHIPVDFLKQDYQRSSPEWQRAMTYLRGDSSLQPSQPNADMNISPIYQLYQGFRRVRTPGKVDLYMGYWDQAANKSVRISRDTESKYYENFLRRMPGYYDDSEWWKLIDEADKQPLAELIDCPQCSSQNLQENDTCNVCGYIFKEKACINPDCNGSIPQSASSCPHCGFSQIPEIEEPWTCMVCGARNDPSSASCFNCAESQGVENMLSREYLERNSHKDDSLSIAGCVVPLADGTFSTALNVDVYVTQGPIVSNMAKVSIPMMAFKGETIVIFLDKSHRIFKNCRIRPEQIVASEIAQYLYDTNRRLVKRQYEGIHSFGTLQWEIIKTYWVESLEDNPEKLREEIGAFFSQVRMRLPAILNGKVDEIFDDLTESQKRFMVNNILSHGKDIGKMGEMKLNGEYLKHIDEDAVVSIFKNMPEYFFDGSLWEIGYNNVSHVPEEVLAQIKSRISEFYRNCLEDICNYLKFTTPEAIIMQRSRASLEYLKQKVVENDVH